MLRKRKLEVRLVKDEEPTVEEQPVMMPLFDSKEIVEITQEVTKTIVTGTVIVIGAVFLTRTAEHVIIQIMKK